MKTLQQSTWMHPTEYALKEYTKEQLLERVLWLQDKIDEQHAGNIELTEKLDEQATIIEYLESKK